MADSTMSGIASGALAGASLNPVGAIAGGIIGAFGASSGQDAANAQEAQIIQEQNLINQQNDPFATSGSRAQYVPMLNQLAMGGVNAVNADPTFQKLNDQSIGNLERQSPKSGATDYNALNLSAQNQMSYWEQMLQTYSGLSGASSPVQMPGMMSPSAAGSLASGTQANYGAGFGSIISGLSSIFGTPNANLGGTNPNNPSNGGAGSMIYGGSVQGNPIYQSDL